jgi:AcrR family transcriptional regulator
MRGLKVQKGAAFVGAGTASRTPAERSAGNSKEQEVLDVASEYFLRHGFDGMSINAMARSSGISKESIYRYFGSKQELFEAVMERELMEHGEKLQSMSSILMTKGLREALLAIARTTLSVITTDRNLGLRRLIFAQAARSPEIGRHYFEVGPGQAYATLRSILAVRVGAKRAGKLANHFMALLAHRVMLERECRLRDEPGEAEIAAAAESSVGDFLEAFLPEESI